MITLWFNRRNLLAIVAILIVSGTIFYSQYLARKIADDERKKVELLVEAQKTILSVTNEASINLAARITSENTEIPLIETNENDSITAFKNLNEKKIAKDSVNYLYEQLKSFKRQHKPIVLVFSKKPFIANKYYYGQSELQQQVRYYPIVQLIIVTLFIIVTIIAQRSSYRSTQNQVWAGLAKETAHQLGTPVSSLQGWIEMLRDVEGNEKILPEMEKDVNRLLLITDRFGKIGSKPHLEQTNIVEQVTHMVEYIKKRAGGKINFIVDTEGKREIDTLISPPLFDWVIENLLKNALDAMDGKGTISVRLGEANEKVIVDVSDTGKGITKKNLAKIFKPGFTTKKRGWDLGLTLTKRIIEQYHKGNIYVSRSEPGRGTTFRIELKKV